MIYVPAHEVDMFRSFLAEDAGTDIVDKKRNPYGPDFMYRWRNAIVFGYGNDEVGYEMFLNPTEAEKGFGEIWQSWLQYTYNYLQEQMEKDGEV